MDSVRLARLASEAADLLAGGEAGGAVERAEEARALWRGCPFAPWSDEPWAAASLVATRGRDRPGRGAGRRTHALTTSTRVATEADT